jgi:hypothetical protein
MECCVEQRFRLSTTGILAWNICWLALLSEPIGITSCKPTPRTYPHDAQLDYFRIADHPDRMICRVVSRSRLRSRRADALVLGDGTIGVESLMQVTKLT